MARYALVIGIGENLAPLASLSKPVGDAQAIADVLQQQGGFEVQRLTGRVEKAQLETAIARLLSQAHNHEALIYYTGHGFPLQKGFGRTEAFLAASDCRVSVNGQNQVTQQFNGLSLGDVNEILGEASLSNLVLLLDCCHSGYLLEEKLLQQTFSNFVKKDYLLITACRSFEQARAKLSADHSVFTEAVLAGLQEANADPKTRVVTGDRLFAFVYNRLKGTGQEALRLSVGRPIELVRFQAQATSPAIDDTNPYQGLLAFTPATARFFFGRDDVVQTLVQKLQRSNFVPLIGPSGSGKSSVVRAGLVPRLQELGWRVLEPIKPGMDPIYELTQSLATLFERRQLPEIRQLMATEGLAGVVARLPDQKHLLVVDQFEEVFTLCEDRPRQRQFIELLTGMGNQDKLAVVTTMRSDFVEQWQAHNDLVATLQTHTVFMPPLTGESLRQAIVQPAQVQGYCLEPGLETLILADVQAEPNCLPLLEFALDQLWQRRDPERRQLTIAAYQEMNQLSGALDCYATAWYSRLTPEEQTQVQRVMLALVRVGTDSKDTRWRRPKAEVAGADPSLAAMVERLVDQRLLVSAGDEIDLAHERLMEGWHLFADWRSQDRDQRRLAQRVEDGCQEWQAKGKHEDYLLPNGLMLEVRDQWHSLQGLLTTAAQDYYHQSEGNATEKVAFIERNLTEIKLREEAMRVSNLLHLSPDQRTQAALKAIRDAGESQAKLHQVLNPVQANLQLTMQQAPLATILQGHGAYVWSVAFSPDGERIVSGSGDNTIRLWDLQGNPIGQPFQGHEASVRSVAFSPDGERIVSGSGDNTIRLWDLQGNPIGQPFQGHEASVRSVAFSPDGEWIVSGSLDNTIRLWDLQGNPIGQPFQGHEASVWSVAFSPDGKRIVSSSDDRTIWLWDLQGNPIGQPFQGHKASVLSVAFSPDGERIVSGSGDNTIRLWDLQGNPVGQPFQGHKASVWSVAFSPDGQTIVSGSGDNTIRLWDLQGNPIRQPFQGHKASVWFVAFSPDGERIVSGSLDKTIRLWDLQSNPIGQPFQGHKASVLSVAFSPDGERIVSSSADQTLRLWDLRGNPIGQPFQGHKASVLSVAFSPDGERIVSSSADQTLRLWDLQGNPIGQLFQGHSDSVLSVAFSPVRTASPQGLGQAIASGSADRTLRLWDLQGNPIGQPFQGHSDSVLSVAFSPDGERIVSSSGDNTIRLWDLQGNLIGQPFQGHKDSVLSVAFSPDGERIVSSSGDNTIRLWDLQGNPIGQPFQGHSDSVLSVAFSPDGQTIVSGSGDNTIRLWDLQGNPIGQPFQGHSDSVLSVAFSPDGQTIVSGSSDQMLRLWRGGWRAWLAVLCNRLRHHPTMRYASNPVAIAACEVCRQYVWERE